MQQCSRHWQHCPCLSCCEPDSRQEALNRPALCVSACTICTSIFPCSHLGVPEATQGLSAIGRSFIRCHCLSTTSPGAPLIAGHPGLAGGPVPPGPQSQHPHCHCSACMNPSGVSIHPRSNPVKPNTIRWECQNRVALQATQDPIRLVGWLPHSLNNPAARTCSLP